MWAIIGTLLFIGFIKFAFDEFSDRVEFLNFHGYFDFLKGEKISRRSTYPSGFPKELKQRFPSNVIYFVPEKVRNASKMDQINGPPAFRENCTEWWERIMQTYPFPPRDENERAKREATFWNTYVQHFTSQNSGAPALRPRQNIIDYFRSWEKWIFREYYAATGIVKETITEKLVEHFVDIERAKALKTIGGNDSVSSREKHQELDRANETMKQFVRTALPAHYEKWGNWFYFNIQQAFETKHQTQSDFGPQSAVGAAHPADNDLIYKPNT
jgi:hypothetical protein